MAELTNEKREKKAKRAKPVQVETGPVAEATEIKTVLELEGFTPEQIAKMQAVKQNIATGKINDLTPEFRKLMFVQWLIEHEKIRS